MRQLRERTGETGEGEVVNTLERKGGVYGCHREVVRAERELKRIRERGCCYTPTVKLGKAVTHTAMQLPFEPSGSWEKQDMEAV